ncbi:MAG: DUF192 domain-containing protein [Thiolinea sp.]
MRWLATLFILICGLTACNGQSNAEQPQVLHFDQTIFLNNQAIKVAVFDTALEREQGLMWVKELPKNHGALFVFEQEGEVRFWMKNTLISLDILFFNKQGQLIKMIQTAQPCSKNDCPLFVAKQVKFVLELADNSLISQNLEANPAISLPM